jgi:hypothetical protein
MGIHGDLMGISTIFPSSPTISPSFFEALSELRKIPRSHPVRRRHDGVPPQHPCRRGLCVLESVKIAGKLMKIMININC